MNRPLFPDLTVNGEAIPAAAVAAEAQNHVAPPGKPGLAWRAAAKALVIRALLLQEAERLGLEPEPRDLGGGRVETADEARIRAVLEASISPEAPGEAALRAAYEADPGRHRAPPLWEAAHILFAAAPGDSEARGAARTGAERAIAVLRENPAAFDALARQNSDCQSRAAGGRLGQIGPGDTVPEFEAALAALAPGEIAPEPVETRFGLHVIRLDARAEGAVLPFEAARPKIAEALEKRAWARAAREFTAALVTGAEISGIDIGRG